MKPEAELCHEWDAIFRGMYTSTYRCRRCGLAHTESLHEPDTARPLTGCTFKRPLLDALERKGWKPYTVAGTLRGYTPPRSVGQSVPVEVLWDLVEEMMS